ncbi:hypothetical protein VR611_01130 [Aquirufa nivalisilvae]
MAIEKVILFVQNKFTIRDFNRFGVRELVNANFIVEVFDFSPILRTKDYTLNYLPQDEISDTYIIKIYSSEDIENYLSIYNPKNTFISCYINLYPNTKYIFEVISKKKLRYAIFRNNCIPDIYPWYRNLLSRINYYLKFYFLSPNISPATVAFVAGRKAKRQLGNKISNNTKFINVASNDFNNYKGIELTKNQLEYTDFPKVIFIDEYYPLHPDLDDNNFISPEKYYELVNVFLNLLTKNLNLNCGIAVHPRADYTKGNPYNFKLYYNRTPELIKNAQLVIGHASTSFSYVLLANKPLIQIGFLQTKNTIYGIGLEVFSKIIGLKKCYIDNKYEIPSPIINQKKYSNYISDYLISYENLEFYDANEALVSYISKLNDNE